MKTITLREFQIKPSAYLDNLPLVLTRYGKPVAAVITPESFIIGKPKPIEEVQLPITSPTEIPEEYTDNPIPPNPALGWCELHFEKNAEYIRRKINYEDENGNMIHFEKWACPECIGRLESLRVGKLTYVS